MLSWSGESTCTPGRLRTLFAPASSLRPMTTSTCLRSVSVARNALALLVDGVCPATSSVIAWMRPLRARSDSAPRNAAAIIFFGVRWL